jgi:hypothetical protein
MTIKKQFEKITDNWLLIVIVLVLLVGFSGIGSIFQGVGSVNSVAIMDSVRQESYSKALGGPYYDSGFAPEVADRKITKTASIGFEVDRGTFTEKEIMLKSLASSSGSLILDQNVNVYGSDKKAYSVGSYTLKVDVNKYDSVISQLKNIGEVKSFNENANDITGRYTDVSVEIDVETSRLRRYNEMYSEATSVQDKITLNDRIFDQERTIAYLKDSLKNMDQRIEYTTVYVSINEKKSNYLNIAFVKFSDLIRTLVGSMNSVLYLFFALLPYAIIIGIVLLIVKFVRRH